MSITRVKVENLSKQYRLGEVGTGTLSHDLNRWWAKLRGKEDPYAKIGAENDRALASDDEYVWALRDINFEVKEGEILGIIGRNGAGKSTLLKLLSKVTGPTEGEIKINGRIGALLEVGTGMHPELTGRENIFLNGALLGMSKKEINSKIEEIIDFSGIAKYIDTPLKRYSSGMRVRLGFAVAAFLEPEILIVDEVLAVGDAEFQKKAIGKMQDISKGHGRTVLFVSHNMAAVKSLCTRAILMENGRVTQAGDTDTIVSNYLTGESKGNGNYKSFRNNEINIEGFNLTNVSIYSKGKTADEPIYKDLEIIFEIAFDNENKEDLNINYRIKADDGQYILVSSSKSEFGVNITQNSQVMRMIIPKNFFVFGTYYVDLMLIKNRKSIILLEKDILSFTIVPGVSELGSWMGKGVGFLRPEFKWEIQNV